MIAFIVFLVGVCVGSFLNVCIYRIPLGKSVIFPASRCQCGERIPFWYNIPILSWLILRGRASCCGSKISIRYLVVELLTGLLFLNVFTVSSSVSGFVIRCIFGSLLLVIAFIDIDTMEVYDILSVGGALIGILVSLFFPNWLVEQSHLAVVKGSLFGICFGSGLMLWVAILGELVLKREAVGFGDVKLLGTIGAFLGWKGCLFALFGGCFFGTMIALPMVFIAKLTTGYHLDKTKEIPFAPFLVIGGILYLLAGEYIMSFLLPPSFLAG